MYKIGIIGSDNSHADAFSKLVNLPDEKSGEYMFSDMKVTAIFGLEKERTEEMAEKGKIEFIAKTPDELMGKVDAVMVVFRHGDLHAEYALPFIEAGIPTWVDKPFAIKNEDAIKMIKAAEKNNTLLTGGSKLKYIYDVLMLKSEVQSGSRIGKVKSAVVNFPATLTNEYGGIYFYGPHLAEMTLAAFGYNARTVTASEKNENVLAVLKYDDYQVAMNFIPGSKEYFAILYGENGTIIREIDIAGCYVKGFEKFAEMLRTGKLPESFENLYTSVRLLNAVMEACETKTEVNICTKEA
jgi:predicted dehydrogenase